MLLKHLTSSCNPQHFDLLYKIFSRYFKRHSFLAQYKQYQNLQWKSVLQMYCSINLWFTFILSYLAFADGYLYLSGM